ncbi:RNA polymerase sigma factor [Nocardioides sp. Leaf285]|uniref:RNA polymerase sigma factor n=1 Tax=Nocardioides sp. Leaf285 TaxID=1736322 RepID=UPI0007037861|nr:RNA polymerase sigma factor [Nocardioides sp. Leaf285]KQP63079.1 hypothetical protein ASF47_18890 [Nocardioides sp. Leaf285]
MDPERAAALTDQAWRDHHSAVREHLLIRARDPYLADDLAAETFVRMLRYLTDEGREQPTHMRAWLFAIARNLMTDHYRTPAARREALAFDPQEDRSCPAAEQHVPLETWQDVLVLLHALSEHQRLVVVLRGLHDLSTAETAQIMGITDQAVRNLRHAAKRRLLAARSDLLRPRPTTQRPLTERAP